MSITPRYYQKDAVDAVITHVKKRLSPCLLSLATGTGKSVVVAELAKFFTKAAPNKKVLCIAPSKELVEQNHKLYTQGYGYQASMYCASAGVKCLRSQVIFASPQTALGGIEKIAHQGVSAIIIDEAHNVTNTMKKLINAVISYEIKGVKVNEKCRIVGMTATPYRMGTGYIYSIDATSEDEILHDEAKAIEPFYSKLLFRVEAGEMVNEGFLSQLVIGDHSDQYDTSKLELDRFGNFSKDSVKKTFDGNTKTERIINEVIHKSQDKMGVMIFASTISHAEEINTYLPFGESAVVTGKLKKKDRELIINDFKARKVKYLVNVDVLTTGFDSPHVDVIAILRATESPGLLQQIIGRALRLHPDKEFALILDYAENIERHGLQSDIFTPEIKARKLSDGGEEIQVECPSCNAVSSKKRRSDKEYQGLAHDRFGYFLVSGTEKPIAFNDEGEPIEWDGMRLTTQILDPSVKDEFGEIGFKEVPIPAHYARRCNNPEAYILSGKPVACEHRYSVKMCPSCFAENDIAARHCVQCKERLVDPNQKLVEKAGQAGIMADGETKLVACASVKYESHTSKAGNYSLMATYATEIGSITAWHSKRQHWIFNRLAKANETDLDDIDEKYTQCDFWSVAPAQIKVKKTINPNGYAKFEVKSVEFSEGGEI